MTWTTHTSIVDTMKLHYMRNAPPPGLVGERQTIIMLHGVTDNGACFQRVADALSTHYDIILLDARGHGSSGAPEQGYSPHDMADDVIRLIAVLGIYQPILIGHSMGAEVAAVVAATVPTMVKAIILEDPPYSANPPSEKQISAMITWWENSIKQQQTRRTAAMVDEALEKYGWDPADADPWAQSKRKVNIRVAQYFRDRVDYDWRATLVEIQCPTLLLTGDNNPHGAIITPEITEQIKPLLTKGEVQHIPGAGHNIRRDQFDAYMKAVRVFIKAQQ